MARLGIIFMPRSLSLTLDVARAAEECGFWGLGVCDSPILYTELYPVITACLLATSTLAVGPNVTNPVTRHWTIHASSARTFEEMTPGRYFLGVGAGDGAVHSIGLSAAKPDRLLSEVQRIRGAAPESTPVHIAVGGPRMAEVAGVCGTGVILGTGSDPTAVNMLHDRALEARSAAGVNGAFEQWALIHMNIVGEEAEVEAAREEIKQIAVAHARHALSATFEAKNVPEEYQSTMRERFAKYDFMQHAQVSGTNSNARLFEDIPEIENYIIDRFAYVGTPTACARRLDQFLTDTDVDGVWIPSVVRDPIRNIRLARTAFSHLLG